MQSDAGSQEGEDAGEVKVTSAKSTARGLTAFEQQKAELAEACRVSKREVRFRCV